MQSLRFQAERRRAVGPTGPAAGEMQGRAGEAVGAGMEPFLPDDDAHPGRPADLNEQAMDCPSGQTRTLCPGRDRAVTAPCGAFGMPGGGNGWSVVRKSISSTKPAVSSSRILRKRT